MKACPGLVCAGEQCVDAERDRGVGVGRPVDGCLLVLAQRVREAAVADRLPLPDLNPAEGVWAHLKKSLGNLAPCSIDDLAGLVRTRLKRMQYRPERSTGSSPRPD